MMMLQDFVIRTSNKCLYVHQITDNCTNQHKSHFTNRLTNSTFKILKFGQFPDTFRHIVFSEQMLRKIQK